LARLKRTLACIVAFTGATPVLLIFLTSEVGGAVLEFRALPRLPIQEPSHA
jgi:hypothetical protein